MKKRMTQCDRDEVARLQKTIADYGPRLTGSDAHRRFVDFLHASLTSLGCSVEEDVHTFERWEARSWALYLEDADGGERQLPVTMYFPYSGETDISGVTAPLVFCRNGRGALRKARGCIAVVEVAVPSLPVSLILKKRATYPSDVAMPRWWRNSLVGSVLRAPDLDRAFQEGVMGVVCIWKHLSAENAAGQVLPFTGDLHACPAVWVDAAVGSVLRSAAKAKRKARLVLEASRCPDCPSRTLYVVVPGRDASHAVIVNTHTDGPNACEENGSIALLSLLRQIVSQPHEKTFVFVFVTGHFRIPQFGIDGKQATSRWLENHRELWDGGDGHLRAVAGVTIEHLGCTEWHDVDGSYRQTGDIDYELVYAANEKLARVYLENLRDRTKARSVVLRPHNGLYFGEGQPLYQMGIPTLSLVPGPDYLCKISDNGDLDKLDVDLMAEQIDSFSGVLEELDGMDEGDIGKVQRQSYGIF